MANSKYTSALLREKLGETLDALLDKQNPMDLDRAKVVADVAQVMINIAKVEIDHMKVSGGDGTGFIVEQQKEVKLPDLSAAGQLLSGRSQQDGANEDHVAHEHNGGDYLSDVTRAPSVKIASGNVTIHKGARY